MIPFKLNAQDVEQIVKSKWFEFSGNLSAGFSYNYTNSSFKNYSPFSYRIMFSPTVTIKGFSFPMSFTYMDSKFNYSKPTFRFGFNPKYKWVQLYTGDNSYNLSPYTVSGQNIKGIGLELTPGKLNFLAFYGKVKNLTLQRDVLIFGSETLPTYNRNIIGVKTGYDFNFLDIEVSVAKIYDELESNAEIINDVKPQENVVMSVSLNSKINKHITLGGEYAVSVLTEDRNANNITLIPSNSLTFSSFLPITANESTRLGKAGSAFVDFTIARQRFGFKIKRIEPFYKSLGLFYINDDFENLTFNTSLNFLKGNIRLNGSVGRQRNNLKKLKSTTNTRTIANLNLMARPYKPLTISTSYSNYSQNQEVSIINNASSVGEFGQVSQNLTMNTVYNIANKKNSNTFSFMYSKFSFRRLEEDNRLQDGASDNDNITVNYSFNNREKKWGLRLGANYYTSKVNDLSSNRYGGTLGFNKTIKKKLRGSVATTFNISESVRYGNNLININRLNIAYKLTKKQSFNLSLNQRNGALRAGQKSNDLRLNFSYSMRF